MAKAIISNLAAINLPKTKDLFTVVYNTNNPLISNITGKSLVWIAYIFVKELGKLNCGYHNIYKGIFDFKHVKSY